MKNKDTEIIKYLIENKSKELNILTISKAIGMDYKNTYSIIKRLEKQCIVKLDTFGQSKRVRLTSKLHPFIFQAEYERRNELLRDKNLAVMLNDFKNALKSKFYILLIFGSYAKRTLSRSSDIDLMFIVPDDREESFEKEISSTAKSLPLPIHYLIFSESQFTEMISSKTLNVGKEAMGNNVILYGIEMYYELI
jgi:predicted transcriptional regulator